MAFLPSPDEQGLALEEFAYRRLRQALVTGAVLPGDHLSIRGATATPDGTAKDIVPGDAGDGRLSLEC